MTHTHDLSRFQNGPVGGEELVQQFEVALRSIPGMVRREVYGDVVREVELFERIYASGSSIYYEVRTYCNDDYDVTVSVVRWSDHSEAWPPRAEVDHQWSIDPQGYKAESVFAKLAVLCAKDAEINAL